MDLFFAGLLIGALIGTFTMALAASAGSARRCRHGVERRVGVWCADCEGMEPF